MAKHSSMRNVGARLRETSTDYRHLLFIQNISSFLIGSNPLLIFHNQLALTVFETSQQYIIDSMAYLIGNEATWAINHSRKYQNIP